MDKIDEEVIYEESDDFENYNKWDHEKSFSILEN